jgi:elongation factor 3
MLTNSMMSPAATSTASSGKAGAFDVATLFVADKSARDEASVALAAAAKKNGVEFFGSIGLNDALVKVCYSTRSELAATRLRKFTFTHDPPIYFRFSHHML